MGFVTGTEGSVFVFFLLIGVKLYLENLKYCPLFYTTCTRLVFFVFFIFPDWL